MLRDMEWCRTQDELPATITPLGLSSTRQWYLYREIHEYCRHVTEDLVCPKPSVDDEEECSDGAAEEETSEAIVPQAKRARRCGKCGGEGHNRRTCNDN